MSELHPAHGSEAPQWIQLTHHEIWKKHPFSKSIDDISLLIMCVASPEARPTCIASSQ